MNLYDSANIRGLDIAELRAATDKPRILFVTNDVLGWRTFGDELAKATLTRDDLYAIHLRFQDDPSLFHRVTERKPWRSREMRYAHGVLVRSWAKQLVRMLELPKATHAFDAIHVSPHLLALGIVRSHWSGPLSVIFDADVREAKSQRKTMTRSEVERQFPDLHLNEARIVRRADRLWAMSRWAAEHMAAQYGLDVDSISIVPPVRSVVARTWDDAAHPGPVRIAFVGNDMERKGGYRLLRWHQERWIGRAELHIFTATRRPSEALEGVVWHQSVQNRLIVSEHLKTMDMFVLPTTSDMSPFAISEAASAGLPIVSSAIGGIGELVQDRVTGFLLDPLDDDAFIDAVERLFDPELRRKMGQASLDCARATLNVDTVMSKFIDGILELAD